MRLWNYRHLRPLHCGPPERAKTGLTSVVDVPACIRVEYKHDETGAALYTHGLAYRWDEVVFSMLQGLRARSPPSLPGPTRGARNAIEAAHAATGSSEEHQGQQDQ